ncbi:hypothetical protein ACFPRL_23705 [Pseudoclavibacter helvolus]
MTRADQRSGPPHHARRQRITGSFTKCLRPCVNLYQQDTTPSTSFG